MNQEAAAFIYVNPVFLQVLVLQNTPRNPISERKHSCKTKFIHIQTCASNHIVTSNNKKTTEAACDDDYTAAVHLNRDHDYEWRLELTCLTPALQNFPKPFHKTQQGNKIFLNFHLTKIEPYSSPSPTTARVAGWLGAPLSPLMGYVVIIIILNRQKTKSLGFLSRELVCSTSTALNSRTLTELRNCAYQGKFSTNYLIE